MDEFIHWPKTLPSRVNNLWWNIVVGDWNLMKNHLVSDSNCNTVILYPSPPITFLKNYKEWQKIALTLSVGDSIPQFTIIIEQDN